MLQLANFRRGVLTPLDNYSSSIGCGAFYSPVRVEYIPIGDELFDVLWASGIFFQINTACGIRIDDYEEACITHDNILPALEVLSKYRKRVIEKQTLKFITMLESLLQNAIKNKMDVWFVL